VPNYGFILAALGIEVAAARRVAKRSVRRQAAFMISASLIVLAGNFAYITGAVPVNLTSLLLAISGALIVVGMVRDGLFGVMPAALPTIAEEHPDGLVVVSPDDRILYANARARQILAPLDLDADVPVRTTLEAARLVPEARIGLEGASDADWWRALGAEEGVLFHRDDDANPSWLHVSATEVRTRGRKQHGHSLRIADWTARHEAERQQRQSRRLESVGALARTVSRDLQASFSLIRGNADLIAEGGGGDQADQRRLARIREATELGLDLAHQLQLYAGTVDASRTVLELSAIADEIRGVVADDLPAAVRIDFARSASPLPVAADPLQIRHGIFELLTNAVEATPEDGGAIRVETGTIHLDPTRVPHLVHGREEPTGDYAYVLVSDEAGGMDAETEERAFEPFFSSRHKDRGNGLSTVLGVARAHGALVALDNQPGRGCTFTLYFPLEDEGGRGAA
jgi:signal transduction histidine kinase